MTTKDYPKTEDTKKERGLIGHLYYTFLKFRRYRNQTDFFSDLGLLSVANGNVYSPIIKHDYFSDLAYDLATNTLDNEVGFLHEIQSHIDVFTPSQRIAFNAELKAALESTETYSTTRVARETDFLSYDTFTKNQLLTFYELNSAKPDLAYHIYLLLYFGVHKHLPTNFYFGRNRTTDFFEFNNEITTQYGVHSLPGIRKIIEMATRENANIFAQFEYADMFYYGNSFGIDVNIPKAFEFYQKASGINKATGEVESASHPLALWSLAFIYFNYKKKGSSLENCPTINDIENWTPYERCTVAIRYCKSALYLLDNGPSANLLGNIALQTEDDLPGITQLKEKYNLKSAEEYYKYSSSKNYVYAYINLAELEIEKAEADPTCRKEHILTCINYLDKAAHMHEPYAANILGRLYAEGIFPSIKGSKPIPMEDLKDEYKALDYFKMATDYYCNTYHSAFAYANMIKYYPDMFSPDNNLLNKFIEKIKEIGNESALKIANDAISRRNETVK